MTTNHIGYALDAITAAETADEACAVVTRFAAQNRERPDDLDQLADCLADESVTWTPAVAAAAREVHRRRRAR
jgi:hypothetical protein